MGVSIALERWSWRPHSESGSDPWILGKSGRYLRGAIEWLRATDFLPTSIEIFQCFNTWHACISEYQLNVNPDLNPGSLDSTIFCAIYPASTGKKGFTRKMTFELALKGTCERRNSK